MRTSKAFLSCAVVTAVLFAATAVMAADPPIPTQCTAADPNGGTTVWTNIQVRTDTPCAVQCNANPTPPLICDPTGACTGIEYTITAPSTLAHVAVLARGGVFGTFPANSTAVACVGDPVTGLGVFSCHEQAIRANPNSQTQVLDVIVNGNRKPIPTSIAAQKGGKIGACTIMGVGDRIVDTGNCVSSCGNFNPDQTLKRTEVLSFKGCAVQFDYDLNTGVLVPGSPILLPSCSSVPPGTACSPNPNCAFTQDSVQNLQVFLGTTLIGGANGKFGSGFISTGSDSCTTYVIGGRVYTWGTAPCP